MSNQIFFFYRESGSTAARSDKLRKIDWAYV